MIYFRAVIYTYMYKTIEIGRRCGKLTVIEFVSITNTRKIPRRLYKCLCDCGKYTLIDSGKLSTNPNSKRSTKSCGCLRSEVATQTKRKGTALESTARLVWDRYKDGCSFEEFMVLSQQECFYCGDLPSRIANYQINKRGISKDWAREANFIYNGLDRIDSSKGHSLDNIVSCCSTCNTMKMAMGQSIFLKHIEKIYKYSVVHLTSPDVEPDSNGPSPQEENRS